MILRNTLGVIAGLVIAFIIIAIGVTINKALFFPEIDDSILNWREIFRHWKKIISQAHYTFFLALLFSAGLGSFLGGIVASFFVKNAKVAYAFFIGLILAFAAWIDIFFTGKHPFWYIISLNIVLFFFAWLGGKVVEQLNGHVRQR